MVVFLLLGVVLYPLEPPSPPNREGKDSREWNELAYSLGH